MTEMEQWQSKVRQSIEYRDSVDLIDEIRATKNKLALLEASLKKMGDAGQLASLDDMEDRIKLTQSGYSKPSQP